MKFEDSKYYRILQSHKLELPFGNFYLCNTFIIGELNEGIHFDWDKVDQAMANAMDFYGKIDKLGYISNRIHSYSVDPRVWGQLDKEYGIIVANAVVYYNDFTYRNTTLEKMFTETSLKRCFKLDEAILWITNLKEFN